MANHTSFSVFNRKAEHEALFSNRTNVTAPTFTRPGKALAYDPRLLAIKPPGLSKSSRPLWSTVSIALWSTVSIYLVDRFYRYGRLFPIYGEPFLYSPRVYHLLLLLLQAVRMRAGGAGPGRKDLWRWQAAHRTPPRHAASHYAALHHVPLCIYSLPRMKLRLMPA